MVRTVSGDIPTSQLGRTNMHESLLRRTALRPDEALDEVDLSTEEARTLSAAGMDSVVELTPPGLGRDPTGLATIASGSGLGVVAATGAHREEHYPDRHWARTLPEDRLAELFASDVTHGCAAETETETGTELAKSADDEPVVRAGVIRLGFDHWRITALERGFLAAAALAQRLTGAAIICQLTRGSAALEILQELIDHGVRAQRVAFSRIDHCPDPALHVELAAAGAYVCYTGAGQQVWPDSAILDCLLTVVERGHATRVLVGGARGGRSRHLAYGGMPGLEYLPRRFLPRLRSTAGSAVTDTILKRNPGRLLSLETPA